MEYKENTEQTEKKSKPIILWIVIIFLVVCLLAIAGSVFAWNRLMPSAQETPLVDVGEDATVALTTESQVTAQPTQPVMCGRSDQQITLLLAYDTMLEYPYGSDGVRLLKVDYANQRIELLALPSRLWVVAPQQAQPALQAASLGELYQYGLNQGGLDVKESRTSAAHLVAQALFDNFGLVSNNFAVIETETFAQLVDSLGGIDITLPMATTLNGQVYNAGTQHWNGATTLNYVRALPAGQDEWDRFARQNLVLSAIKSSAQASSGLTQIPDLLVQFGSGLTTDLSLTDMSDLSCLSKQIPSDQVQIESLPANLVSSGPGIYLMPDYEAMKVYLQGWMSGR
jgi:anionic cell wall polymer biosynthesis LytR-Cps2A-Psr (LCP) family protein